MSVHEKIKFIRQMKGWSREDMAEKLAMSINGYGSIERGETNVNLSRLEQIANLFGMELSELVAINEKSVFYISGANSTGQITHEHCEINSFAPEDQFFNLQKEFEKLQLINELKDKEILLKDQEISNLQKIISLLENKILT